MAITIGNAFLWLKVKSSDFEKSLNRAQKDIERWSRSTAKSFQAIGQMGQQVGAAMTVVGGAITGAMAYSVKAAMDSEAATAQLDAVLKSTGNAAGLTKDELVKMAGEMQNLNAVEDDLIIKQEAVMLTFTGISKKTFPDAMQAAIDLSQALGQDLQSSVIQIGKALNDPIKGVTALRRVGVSFTSAQIEQIKALVESNNLLGAQKIILDELNREFGGQGAAYAKTLSGQFELLKITAGNVAEEFGFALLPILRDVLPNVIALANQAIAWLNANQKQITASIREYATVVKNTVLGALQQLQQKFGWVWEKVKLLNADHPKLTQNLIALAAVIGPLLLVLGPIVYAFGSVSTIIASLIIAIPTITSLIVTMTTAITGLGVALIPAAAALAGLSAILQMAATGDWTHNWITDLIDKVTFLKDAIDAAFDSLVRIIDVITNGTWEEKFRLLLSLIEKSMRLTIPSIGAFEQITNRLPSFASGGVMPRSGLAMVGERGPEIVSLPGGARVYNSGQAQRMIGASGVTVNVASLVVREEADVQRVARELKMLTDRALLARGLRA